jgi:hypothetical protein
MCGLLLLLSAPRGAGAADLLLANASACARGVHGSHDFYTVEFRNNIDFPLDARTLQKTREFNLRDRLRALPAFAGGLELPMELWAVHVEPIFDDMAARQRTHHMTFFTRQRGHGGKIHSWDKGDAGICMPRGAGYRFTARERDGYRILVHYENPSSAVRPRGENVPDRTGLRFTFVVPRKAGEAYQEVGMVALETDGKYLSIPPHKEAKVFRLECKVEKHVPESPGGFFALKLHGHVALASAWVTFRHKGHRERELACEDPYLNFWVSIEQVQIKKDATLRATFQYNTSARAFRTTYGLRIDQEMMGVQILYYPKLPGAFPRCFRAKPASDARIHDDFWARRRLSQANGDAADGACPHVESSMRRRGLLPRANAHAMHGER